jgi:DNA modification methylase
VEVSGAREVVSGVDVGDMRYENAIIHGSCLDILPGIETGTIPLVFADPPFNIGLKYDVYSDRVDYGKYCAWLDLWITEVVRILAKDGSCYIAIGDEYAAEVNLAMKRAGLYFRNWIIWHYGFGQSQRKKFARSHTHILYFTKSREGFIWNGDSVRVPSARQLRYRDKRANPLGKIPDDVWCVEQSRMGLPEAGYQDVPDQLSLFVNNPSSSAPGIASGDKLLCDKGLDSVVNSSSDDLFQPVELEDGVWEYARLCGTFKERIKGSDGSVHPCQMPEDVLRRVILVSSGVGDIVLDPFCGTGTTAAVAKSLGRGFVTMDISEEYCRVASMRLFGRERGYVTE